MEFAVWLAVAGAHCDSIGVTDGYGHEIGNAKSRGVLGRGVESGGVLVGMEGRRIRD